MNLNIRKSFIQVYFPLRNKLVQSDYLSFVCLIRLYIIRTYTECSA